MRALKFLYNKVQLVHGICGHVDTSVAKLTTLPVPQAPFKGSVLVCYSCCSKMAPTKNILSSTTETDCLTAQIKELAGVAPSVAMMGKQLPNSLLASGDASNPQWTHVH